MGKIDSWCHRSGFGQVIGGSADRIDIADQNSGQIFITDIARNDLISD